MLAIVIILIITAIIVSLINIYCVIIIIYNKKLSSSSHMTIFSLLVGHAIQGLLVIPCYAAKRSGIYKYTVVCDIFRFSYLFTNYACCLSVLVISVDRFIGVQFPLHYKAWVTSKRLARILLCVWTYVLILCLLPFAPSDSMECKYNPQKWWVMMMLIGNTLLPFVIIIACYVVIFKKVKSVLVSRQSRSNNLMEQDLSSSKARKLNGYTKVQIKRTKLTFLIVGAYVLCWGPSFVYNLLLTLCPDTCFSGTYRDSEVERIVGFVTKLLTFIDGIIAPTIYCWSNANFTTMRRTFVLRLRKRFTTEEDIFVRGKAVRYTRDSSQFFTENSSAAQCNNINIEKTMTGKPNMT